MKYLINFQIIITFKNGIKKIFRSTYTIMEKEMKYKKLSFSEINNWFNNFFNSVPLDTFIDTSSLSGEVYESKIKIGRITETLSGKYETFKEK